MGAPDFASKALEQARAAEPTCADAWTATAALHTHASRKRLALEGYSMACTLGAGAESHLHLTLGMLTNAATAEQGKGRAL